jgi:hypothetical protein
MSAQVCARRPSFNERAARVVATPHFLASSAGLNVLQRVAWLTPPSPRMPCCAVPTLTWRFGRRWLLVGR